MFALCGVLDADVVIPEFSSRAQLLGMVLLITFLPVWLFACFFVTQRHSLRLVQQLQRELFPEQDLVGMVTQLPGLQMALGFLGGAVYALAFNIPRSHFREALDGNLAVLSIFIGQLLLWLCVGVLLAVRLHIARIFFSLGKRVELSPFEQSRLEPFARVGMLDVAIVVGGLVIGTVQSIDAQFRLENYLSGLLVAIPAAAVLLIAPMWSLHRRLAARKRELIAEVGTQLQGASEASSVEQINELESLLRRRERVRALNTWPLDVAIWRRLLFYGLLPPLAWSGAAIVEVMIERLIAP